MQAGTAVKLSITPLTVEEGEGRGRGRGEGGRERQKLVVEATHINALPGGVTKTEEMFCVPALLENEA